MTTVRISYDPDLSKIGTIQDVPADEARLLVRRGRATYVRDEARPIGGEHAIPAGAALRDAVTAAYSAQSALNDAVNAGDQPESTSLDLDDDES
jgi:hypothetical protein